MAEDVRVGVIGTGYWGKNLIRNFDELGVLTGFCDINPNARAEFSSRYPAAKAYAEAVDLVADPMIDGVAIATPAETHGKLVRMALEGGKHVFVEKPLCLDVQEGRQLADMATQRGLTLMVGHLLLYHPAFCSLKQFVDNGELGELRYIMSNRLSLGKIRREENALWSFAPHDISMILSLTGCLPVRVMAHGGTYLSPSVADTTLSHLAFHGGVQAHIYVSWLHPYKDQRLVVVGSKAMVVFDDVMQGDDKLLVYRHQLIWQGYAMFQFMCLGFALRDGYVCPASITGQGQG